MTRTRTRMMLAAMALGGVLVSTTPALAGPPLVRQVDEPTTTTASSTTEPTTTTTSTTEPTTTTTTTTLLPTTPPPPPPPPPTTLAPPPPPVTVPPPFGVYPISTNERGQKVKNIQYRLLSLGFWLTGVDGRWGLTTQQAVLAFQKYYGLPRTSRVDKATAALLNTSLQRPVAQGRGDLFEVDKTRQVGMFVRNSSVVWVVNIASGSGKPYKARSKKNPKQVLSGDAQTPVGRFRVYFERPTGWWEGELGRLYRPKYFNQGIAVHGSNNIPAYPASHGCVRVSSPLMDYIWAQNLLPKGTQVWVRT